MNLYAETSAVVSWLLAEESGDSAWSHLTAAASVSTSDLTLIECDLIRNLFPDVRVLSFDERIRDNAAALGFDVAPSF